MSEPTVQHEVIAAHLASSVGALRILISMLERDGTLKSGQYQQALADYIELARDGRPDLSLIFLDEIRRNLSDHSNP